MKTQRGEKYASYILRAEFVMFFIVGCPTQPPCDMGRIIICLNNFVFVVYCIYEEP